ncbi:MAG: alpha-galactosidase [Bacteroidales bacterium]|nr:alpha-galactosidase [Bacteroidales bacterium]
MRSSITLPLFAATAAFIFLLSCNSHEKPLEGRYFSVSVDRRSGDIHIKDQFGDEFISSLKIALHSGGKELIPGEASFRMKGKILAGDSDAGGKTAIIRYLDRRSGFKTTLRLSLPDSVRAVIAEIVCTNISDDSLPLQSMEPVRLISRNGGFLRFGNSDNCLTNGAMYYDAGMIHVMDSMYIKPKPYGETKGGKMLNTALDFPDAAESWWNIALFSDLKGKALSAGYITNDNSLGRIKVRRHGSDTISLVAESVFCPGHLLEPGGSISSDKFMISISGSLDSALTDYSSRMRKMPETGADRIINGWCSWFYTHGNVTEKEVLANADFISENLLQYGMEYVQVDEGFQSTHGEWDRGPGFPGGMKKLAEEIISRGLKPGLWLAPFVISDNTDVFRDHKDWLLKNPDGSLKRVGPWPSEDTDWYRDETPERYCLDITHPDAEKWLKDLVDTIVNNWGYRMLKIDFVAWTVFSADHFHDRTSTPAQVYRKAFELMREAAGDSCHILDCGPGQVTAGLINSMRIEYDQNYGYLEELENQYFRGPSSSSGALGKRYFNNYRNWVNDIDHICISHPGPERSKAIASLIGISGGNTISGDKLDIAPAYKIGILKKVLPSAGLYTRPVLSERMDPPTVFYTSVVRSFGTWNVAACFNPGTSETWTESVALTDIGLVPGNNCIAYDFWEQKLHGEFIDSISFIVPPGGVCVLAVREKRDEPFVLATDRHMMQGAIEIEAAGFDRDSGVLSVTSCGPAGSSHNVIVYVPGTYRLKGSKVQTDEHGGRWSAAPAGENLVRVNLAFPSSGKLSWSIGF